ncbi:biotin/lipoyl-binding protein [Amphritea balenae]|uniref:Biotin/lipoyl-binding protein n=1 Tax=Amphritea balenae TaxID=452629 RepID=A0A3P1SX34_9GAMM|nr:biotin/lipoyl-binding protein [Amphritea balenae]RRD01669.1 biotin/lipoyl-binding protein [Amphritea balenae]GGK55148.1 hypothetical protein GCM10007941_01480 [Amphritea balenae]
MIISQQSKRAFELEFLPAALEVVESPPAPFGRILAVIISLFFVLTVIWAWYGSIDVISTAQGTTIPAGKIKIVQPLETAVVRAINVEDGQQVRKGELLIQLDPSGSDIKLATATATV